MLVTTKPLITEENILKMTTLVPGLSRQLVVVGVLGPQRRQRRRLGASRCDASRRDASRCHAFASQAQVCGQDEAARDGRSGSS
jgi:hypothetical protein